ncbi:uncharacterized protein Dwil_GK17127 [Drosophila willistoni]|uniref:DUF4794 domain-containing protein n=1 Tax=Drosophila willistoni TaxID=7260 RepID=B4MNF7_DROWI|nr:extensin [Drosophila willistoni]EDW72666.2 uncharacterized protein Dwil_GK17127 [Drosophila willistoni]
MVAPYPPAGLTPNPPFDLPTEEQPVAFPEPDVTYGPPDQTYGPPDQTYGPPDLTYGPPDAEEVEVVPAETYGPPAETYGPPPPTAQPANDPAAASPPQSAALINLASLPLPPQAQFVLPLLNRFTAFRNLRTASATPQRPKPAKLQARPQAGSRPRPAKIINGNAVFPSTQLALPFADRRIPFRPARLIVNGPLRRRLNH